MQRREFLKTGLAGVAAPAQPQSGRPVPASPQPGGTPPHPAPAPGGIRYPRTFAGRQLEMIAFPMGGVAAGSISLGGRGQLRDWEIFNKPDKGYAPIYAFPAIWVQAANRKPVARVLESRYLPPYEGQTGLGFANAPGLARLASATFTGEFPLARVDFADRTLPVKVSLEAFTPFVPLNADESGLPVAILRYRVRNSGGAAARVSIAFSVENPVGARYISPSQRMKGETRENEGRKTALLQGLFMRNPGISPEDPLQGSFALTLLDAGDDNVTVLRGWPQARWWAAPMLFWDDFSADGQLGPESEKRNAVGSVCLRRTIAPGRSADYTFMLAWHFPNRTPARCGWKAPRGEENTVIGNWYCTRFPDAWAAAEYAAANLQRLEGYTRQFAKAMRESTLPAPVKEAATANLSTLVTTTCFRTADGEFHGFEGVNDAAGCCFGNCTHVWNYETATAYLFPSLARSLRRAAFGYSMDDAGAMHFRQLLPDGKERSGFAAADGQMGQIMHAYLDWKLSGDRAWLEDMWPRVEKALEFAWVPGGWDADRDGVLEGVQHNTYDVEFYGPNPQCGIYYLGALRAGEEIARTLGHEAPASEYRRLFESGKKWIDAHLFNGEYYVQEIRGYRKDRIAPALRSDMGADDTEKPEFQLGDGCLVDQLVGQYLAEVAGLGSLLDPGNVRKALQSIYRYNYKRTLFEHNAVQRAFALNDESALVICDYGRGKRPGIPFPYYAEVMTGFEYQAAVHMLYAGMVAEGVECIGNIRRRYDGERRNPWDEAECGHHYARAMAAWSAIAALSGFRYHAGERTLTVAPRVSRENFASFWSTARGWGTFSQSIRNGALRFVIAVNAGSLPIGSVEVAGRGQVSARLGGQRLSPRNRVAGGLTVVEFPEGLELNPERKLELSLGV